MIDFLLDQVSRLNRRHDGDLVGGAVFLAVKQATAPPFKPTGTPNDRPAPPRAISVRAVAQSLGFSYETTRRRVIALEEAGLAQRLGDAGVTVMPYAFERDCYREDAAVSHQAVLDFYAKLAKLGVEFPAPPRPPTLEPGDVDIAVAGHCDDFVLRVIEIGAIPHSSSMAGLVFASMLSANADLITYDPDLAHRYARFDTPPPDSARRPATITEIGLRLGLPHEVVRRRVLSLIERGYARRITGGYLVNMDVLQSSRMQESGQMISQRFVQMTQALLALGVDPSAGKAPSP